MINTQQKQEQRKLKVALIVDSEISSKYDYDLANWGQTQNDVIISHLIIQHKEIIPRSWFARLLRFLVKNGIDKLLSKLLWRFVYRYESKKLEKSIYIEHLKNYDLSNVVHDSITISPIVSGSGFVYRFSDEDVARIEALNCDLLIRCGSGILRGKILSASRLGIISFHHADNRTNRGGPAGFWEVYNREDRTGFIIQHLTEELDGGNVLIRGSFPTKTNFLLNQATVLTRSNFYMKKLLLDIAKNNILPVSEQQLPYFNTLFKAPNTKCLLIYVSKLVYRKANSFINNFFLRKHERWGVAFYRTDWTKLVMWRGSKIENPPNHFLADPFVISEDGRDYCFVEDYDYKISKACISVYELKEKDAVRLGEAIVEPFHMSFPYLFRFDSKIYMVPETCANNDIRLYECVQFPKQWELKKTIMSNVSAADTMIFEYSDRWWLFSNIALTDSLDHCSELSIFYTDNPITGDWTPHAKNPVIISPTNARNAGILFGDNSVFRVSQRYEFGQYGAGFSINLITSLDSEEYSERELCSINPKFFKNLKGTHHLHSNGKVSVYDFVENIRMD